MHISVVSELVESDNVNRLDFFFECLYPLLHQVCGDFLILDSRTNLYLEDTVSDWLFLPLGLPEETIHLNAKDLVCESVQVSFCAPGLDIPNDERLGNRCGLLLLGFGFLCLLLERLGSCCISLSVLREGIEIVRILRCSCLLWSSSACFATTSLVFASFLSTCGRLLLWSWGGRPACTDVFREATNELVPRIGFWSGVWAWNVASECNVLLMVIFRWLSSTKPQIVSEGFLNLESNLRVSNRFLGRFLTL